jgi:hypothetical protein
VKHWFSKQNAEWAVDLWLRLRGNRLARNAGYLILAAVAAVSNAIQLVIAGIFSLLGKNIQIPDTPYWVVVAFVAAAAVLLIVDRLAPSIAGPNAHDVQLFRAFEKLITPSLLHFLREHSFGQTWQRERLMPIEDLEADWRGARYEFHDKQLQAALVKVLEECRALEDKLGVCSYTHDVLRGHMTVYTRIDEQRGPQPFTLGNIKTLNETARRLLAAINELLKVGRAKIPPEPSS